MERVAPLVSAIVPVFNEQLTVARVVATLRASPLIGEVICVDDGSTDGSRAILQTFGETIVLLALPANGGKGRALAEGIRRARGTIVACFDADLTTLGEPHVRALLRPILTGEARAVLGYPCGPTPESGRRLARFTGERAYWRADLEPRLAVLAGARFGAEVVLNGVVGSSETRLVPLVGLVGLDKIAKHGWPDALREYWGEAADITGVLAHDRLSAVSERARRAGRAVWGAISGS